MLLTTIKYWATLDSLHVHASLRLPFFPFRSYSECPWLIGVIMINMGLLSDHRPPFDHITTEGLILSWHNLA